MKNIKLVIVKNYEEMSLKAFEIFQEQVKNGSLNFGMATGSTPLGLYSLIKEDYKSNKTYENLNYFNLDEYHGIDRNHPESYYQFMKDNLFNEINASNCFIPDASLPITDCICEYQKILDNTQIDLQILGIGNNGHIGFNEPPTSFDIQTNYVKLNNSTRQANKRFFNNNIDEVPEYAVTMGIKDILRAKKIVLMANGENKATAIYQMLFEEPTEQLPASALQLHNDVTVIIDYKAASKLPLNTLGIDISSTRIKVATFNSDYKRIKYEVLPHNNTDIYDKMLGMVKEQLTDEIYNVGLSISGYVREGLVSHPLINFDNFPIKEKLEQAINRRVVLMNRANASAFAEYKLTMDNNESLYYISLATGIGGGYIANGDIVSGKNGLGGEICNMVIDSHQFFDDFYADGSIEMHYNTYKLTHNEKLFIKQIGIVIANIINTVDPDKIIVDVKNTEIDKSITKKIEEKTNALLYSQKKNYINITGSLVEDESLIGAAIYANKL